MPEDSVKKNSVSRVACEIAWGGVDANQPRPELRALGSNLLVVDGVAVAKDHTAPLRVGSKIRFMYQRGDSEVATSLVMVVRGASAVASSGNPDAACAVPTTTPDSADCLPKVTASATLPPPEPVRVDEMKGSGSAGAAPKWCLECVQASGLTAETLALLPTSQKQLRIPFDTPDSTQIFVGRQYQLDLFESLLANQRELLTFVSRCHLRLELASPSDCVSGTTSEMSSDLQVTNLSRNIALVGSRALRHGESAIIGRDEMDSTLSFAAQVELMRQSDTTLSRAADVGNDILQAAVADKVTIAPFLTFRVIRAD